VPRPPRLSRAEVVDAALAIADERGLAAVTMSAIASRLGATPMALYHHVDSKERLLDLLIGAVLSEVPSGVDLPPGWAQLEAFAHGLREVANRHPAVFLLLLQRPAVAPESLDLRERVRDALRSSGVSPDLLDRGERLVSTVALGFLASEVGGRFVNVPREQRDADFGFLLELVRSGLPTLSAYSTRAAVPDDRPQEPAEGLPQSQTTR
jgi:AcrR family transcriptional regulator